MLTPRTRISLRLFFRFVFLFAIAGLMLALSGCSGSTSDDGGGTPAVKLAVVATYPANGTTGPFDIYTPNPRIVRPHFTVQFNRVMDPLLFTTGMVKVSGGSVALSAIADAGMSHGNVVAFRVVKQGGGNSARSEMYGIGVTYTVTIDSTVQSPDGQVLGHATSFSFTPEPQFRVTGFNFASGEVAVPLNLEIYFNARLGTSILHSLSIQPPLADAWVISSATDSTSAVFNSYPHIFPSTMYWVAVLQGATDRDGHALPAAVQQSFSSPALVITHTSFPDSNNVNLSSIVTLHSNYALDAAAALSAFSITPAADVSLIAGEKEISFSAPGDLAPSTSYTAQLSTSLRTVAGYSIPAPVELTFRTAAFGYSHVPPDGTTGFSRHDVIALTFTGAIKSESANDTSITVTPAFEHYIRFGEENAGKTNIVYYVPKSPLPPVTQFTVKVANTIRSIGGYTMAQPDSFKFTTGF